MRLARVGFLLALLVLSTTSVAGAVSADAAVQIASLLTDHLQAGRYQEAVELFSPQMQAMISAEKLAATWSSLPEQLGVLKTLDAPYVVATGEPIRMRLPAHFERTSVDFSIAVNAAGQIAEFIIMPYIPRETVLAAQQSATYVKPNSFTETELVFGSPAYPLHGTLTIPQGEGPFPAVVLVHGSGPNDRDETVGPNKPFRDIAQGLASQGIAVFRYDKRTYAYGKKMNSADINVENEVLADAIAAVQLVAAQPKIERSRILVLGHSMGGTFAPVIAQREPLVSGIIVMAGAARPLYDLILEQYTYVAKLDGVVAPEEQAQLDAVAADVAQIRAGVLPADGVLLDTPAPYWEAFRTLNPPAVARALQKPVLVLQGERDYQVPMTEYNLWLQQLQDVPNAAFHLYPGLNHLFLNGQGQPSPAEYLTMGHVEAQVVADIGAWVLGR